MDSIIVTGNGPLNGTIPIAGAKKRLSDADAGDAAQ